MLLAAPNQFTAPVVAGGQPAVSTGGMQFVPQPVNYPGVPQQFVPAGYGFYAPPQMHGAPVPAGFAMYGSSPKQFSAVNGATGNPGSNSAGGVAAGTQQTAAQPAAGPWPSQSHQVVNPFLVSIQFNLLSVVVFSTLVSVEHETVLLMPNTRRRCDSTVELLQRRCALNSQLVHDRFARKIDKKV